MKLDVPFYAAKRDTDCGPLALKMALEFFGEEHSFDDIATAQKALPSGLVWSIGIARAATKHGFFAKFFSCENFNLDDNDIAYYEEHANNEARKILRDLLLEAKDLDIAMEQKDLGLEDLLSYVSHDSLPIVLVNWFVLGGVSGFNGHFLLVTGFDEEFVYVHNPGLASAQAHLPIRRDLFLKAWESKGTDKDTVVICKKSET